MASHFYKFAFDNAIDCFITVLKADLTPDFEALKL